MGLITEILVQAKNKNRVNLYMDGEFCCGLDLFTVKQHRLKAGMEISEPELEQITFDSECASAFEKSMGFLHIRMRSEQEVCAYLSEKTYTAAVIERTVQKLLEYGFINDAHFAKLYVESYRARWGIKKIEFELRKTGVESEVIQVALAEVVDQSDDAFRLALRHQGKNTVLDKRKLYAHLSQKGFDSFAIVSAIERLQDALSGTEENTD